MKTTRIARAALVVSMCLFIGGITVGYVFPLVLSAIASISDWPPDNETQDIIGLMFGSSFLVFFVPAFVASGVIYLVAMPFAQWPRFATWYGRVFLGWIVLTAMLAAAAILI